MDNIKEHVNYMATSWYIYGTFMDDTWILGQK